MRCRYKPAVESEARVAPFAARGEIKLHAESYSPGPAYLVTADSRGPKFSMRAKHSEYSFNPVSTIIS